MFSTQPRFAPLSYQDKIGKTNAIDYLETILKDPPFQIEATPLCYRFISNKINQVAKEIYEELRTCLMQSPEHINRVYTLAMQPCKAGSTEKATSLLPEATAFEQTIALEHWMYLYRPLSQVQTFCFANSLMGRVIPIRIKKGAQDLMSVKLGNQGKNYPAPIYDSNWSLEDPWEQPQKENFIYHLEALEIVRQPDFIGATLIKGNAFESKYLDQDWRYGVVNSDRSSRREACVEFRSQRKLPLDKLVIKIQSAAYNLTQLIAQGYADIDLCDHLRNEALEFFDLDEQIPSNFSMRVSPRDLAQSLNDCFKNQNSHFSQRDALYYQIFKLMIAKIGPQSTPNLRTHIINRLSQETKQQSST